MCTVTYIPTSTGFILTSSRDEKVYRPTLEPHLYQHFDQKLLYPKDLKAGGTWIAVSEHNQIACLLNGAYENHQKKAFYRNSRGQILLESFKYEDARCFYEDADFSGVEPFTLILIKDSAFHKFRWDGLWKYIKEMDRSQPGIWSSVTLYDRAVRDQREKWFNAWLNSHKHSPGYDIAEFHLSCHGNERDNDILMKRSSGLQTLSVSQIRNENSQISFRYIDLLKGEAKITFLKDVQETA
jgi:hypothetical protein